jgi:hypothetical protein
MKKLNLPPLHLACSNVKVLAAYNCVFIDGEYAVATDAHVLVKVKLEMIPDEILAKINGMMIHRKTWKFWCSDDCIDFVLENETAMVVTTYGKLEIRSELDVRFPDYRNAINDENMVQQPIEWVGIEPNILARGLRSVGAKMGSLRIFSPNKGICVVPMYCDFEAEILFMPAMVFPDQKDGYTPFDFIRK